MKLIMLMLVSGLVGWWMWTSMGGEKGVAAMPGGGPKAVTETAEGSVDALNEATRKSAEAARQAVGK
jgi:hypothetical protein